MCTLRNKIDIIRENISFYDCFDILIYNETNCIIEILSNGKSDIELDGFHGVFINQCPKTQFVKQEKWVVWPYMLISEYAVTWMISILFVHIVSLMIQAVSFNLLKLKTAKKIVKL